MTGSIRFGHLSAAAAICAPLILCAAAPTGHAQVFVVQPQHIEQHYSNFNPTTVKLPSEPLTTVGRERLIRFMQSEQGFAMRPLPIAPVDLEANGPMSPNGEKYIDALHAKGISAKPGDRLVVTNIQIREKSIILDLNNGPFHKHRFLRHVSIGMGAADAPLAQDDGTQPTGSRVTLTFPGRVPDLSGEQLEALLKPMIDFGVKSPAEAYSESLPDFLRKAIMEHRVLIGMDKDMVIYAKGQPGRKDREEVDGKNTEIWIYGEAPQPVEFVRFDGNFVVRTELAKVGEPVLVQTQNQMGDYNGNKPAVAANQHEVQLGDRTAADVDQENAPKAPPTLREPGEKLPADSEKGQPTMAPVNYPPGMQRPGDPGYSPTVSAQQPNGSGQQPAKGDAQQQNQQGSGSSSANPIDPPPSSQSSQKPQ